MVLEEGGKMHHARGRMGTQPPRNAFSKKMGSRVRTESPWAGAFRVWVEYTNKRPEGVSLNVTKS